MTRFRRRRLDAAPPTGADRDGEARPAAEGAVATDDLPSTDEPGDDDPAGVSGGPAADRRRARWATVLPWVLVVLAVAVAGASTWQWQQLAADEREREAVERTAGSFVLTLTSWDATEGMAETREELREAGTDRFAGEVDELFGTTEDLAELAEIGARSQGEVRRLHLQQIEGDRALALVVALQRLTTDVTEGEEVSMRYAEVELIQRHGRWLVDDVELLVDVARQEATPIAPGTDEPAEGDR